MQEHGVSSSITCSKMETAPPATCGMAAPGTAVYLIESALLPHMLCRNAKPDIRLEDVCQNLDDPRDVEIVARWGWRV